MLLKRWETRVLARKWWAIRAVAMNQQEVFPVFPGLGFREVRVCVLLV